jgi:protein-L-isoaspartate O-methyltransferase
MEFSRTHLPRLFELRHEDFTELVGSSPAFNAIIVQSAAEVMPRAYLGGVPKHRHRFLTWGFVAPALNAFLMDRA